QWCQIDNDASLVGNAETIMMSDGVDLKAMTAFTIPDGVIRIGDYAFAGCTSLASMSIPASVTEISGNAFKGCDDIETVQYRGTLAQWCQIDNGAYLADNAETIMMSDGVDLKAINALTIPDGVTRIGGCAFRSCTSLVSVSIPEGVTEIGINAFYGCTSLATVSIPASVKKIGSLAFDRTDFYCLNKSASVKKIRGSAFEEKNLKTVQYRGTLAQWLQIDDDYSNLENAKTITMSDVVDLKAMTALAISEGVTKIRKMAFYDCSSLASISIPASVTEIGINAFSGCRSLATVSIPAGVTEIGSGAFNLCSSLATVSIPASVKKIDWSAFSGCKSLAKITFSGTKEQWRNISKDYYWHTNVPAKKVVCTDGEADLD
ncbi:MAG: leucine-rich repeat domain-containing protein, partial [Treponemataceae bacterium]|nr:leucine-rich repeat domain-containing protein [Treponemataceae bacterium]